MSSGLILSRPDASAEREYHTRGEIGQRLEKRVQEVDNSTGNVKISCRQQWAQSRNQGSFGGLLQFVATGLLLRHLETCFKPQLRGSRACTLVEFHSTLTPHQDFGI